ncbi:phasin [Methylovirgula sp. 4M-Z18]|uniref:phasin n=1 Tax=Methylovirgula sp. 4M-Z18 TaxID=2293567 RepID=UPI000E2F8F08|nr:phasin [Methylovirgula sp. 4M-Z18]RFB79698.1 phasin [Methylovirgula sp. 4M-Z18]
MANPPKKTAPKADAVTEAAPLEVAAEQPALELAAEPAKVTQLFDVASAPVREIQENVRKATEKSVEDTRAAYARVKTVAEDATSSLEASYAAATKGIVALNTKALEAVRTNTEAAFDFAKALFGAKTVAEAINLQTEHARKTFETVTAQSKELAALAQKVATDSVEPLKTSVSKAFSAH